MEDSIFTKMIKGEVDCQKVYEDDLTFAFLDQKPLTRGHIQVLPKEQIDQLDACSPELYEAVFATVRKISILLKSKLDPLRIGLVVHGFEVAHAHVHVVPLYTGKELHLAAKERENPSDDELKTIATILLS